MQDPRSEPINYEKAYNELLKRMEEATQYYEEQKFDERAHLVLEFAKEGMAKVNFIFPSFNDPVDYWEDSARRLLKFARLCADEFQVAMKLERARIKEQVNEEQRDLVGHSSDSTG